MRNQKLPLYRRIGPGVVLLLFAIWVAFKLLNWSQGSGNGFDCEWTERMPLQELEYSSHAMCRMECREVSRGLVEDVYLHGTINCKKSGHIKEEQRYALEKRDQRGDLIRVIVADEGEHHVIVTVIRIDQQDKCECS